MRRSTDNYFYPYMALLSLLTLSAIQNDNSDKSAKGGKEITNGKSVAECSHYWHNYSHYVRSFINFVCAQLKNAMAKKQLNRLKVVLAEKNKTGIWLAQQLGKDRTTVSKWCSNAVQPSFETIIDVAQCLGVGVEELIRMPEKNGGEE